MSYVSVYRCDVCGKQREESNHWFLASVGKLPKPEDAPAITFLVWNELLAAGAVQHLCGQQCAQILQGKWMDEQRQAAEKEASNGEQQRN